MEYKLIGDNNFFLPLETILNNRGIKDVKLYLDSFNNPSVVNHYSRLKNIDKAVNCLLKHVKKDSNIWIQTDPDFDGISSSVILVNYLHRAFKNINIQWRHQEGKQHGVKAKHVPSDIDLVITPDSASSDYQEHKKLYDRGIDIIVLDHHLTEKESDHAIVVNNQISPQFSNKSLSGVGIVYNFLRALDDEIGFDYADDYLDLTACGIIGDVMDLREKENRYYITQGLKNIRNPMLKEMFSHLEYSTKGKKNPMTVGWYISPLVNACLRNGSMEEKEQMFNAFLDDGKTEVYYERGERYEALTKSTVRMMSNIRVRQNKLRDKGVELIEQKIKKKNLLDNKVLVVEVGDILDENLTGLVANRLLKYKRPVILLRYNKDNDTLSGSARGSDKSDIGSFREMVLQSGYFNYALGHDSAFGLQVDRIKMIDAIEWFNDILEESVFDNSLHEVDLIIPAKSLAYSLVRELDQAEDVWGKGVEQPYIAVEGLEVERRTIKVIGKNQNVIKFESSGIEYIKFGADGEDKKRLIEHKNSAQEIVRVNLVGRCSINEFRGQRTGQVIIEDYEVESTKEKKLIF